MTKPSLLTLLAITLLAPLSSVTATANEWAVVPITRGDEPAITQSIAMEVGRELGRQGRSVWRPESARVIFERKISADPVALSEQSLQRWMDDSLAGLRKLALGERGAALEHLQSAVQMSRAALAYVNRDDARAQRVLDTCLYLVRALLEVGEPVDARQQAQECTLLAPSGTPQALMHPPAALALYEDARRQGAERSGKLIVESEKTGCTVRINGRPMGRTPFETSALRTGVYAVQVECGGGHPGRIHSASVGANTTRLGINTGIDGTVRTDPGLRLEYRANSPATVRIAAARSIARALPARWVILVSEPDADTIELDLVGEGGSQMGCARIQAGPLGLRSDSLTTAVRDVVAGNCRDASASNARVTTPSGAQSLFNSGN